MRFIFGVLLAKIVSLSFSRWLICPTLICHFSQALYLEALSSCLNNVRIKAALRQAESKEGLIQSHESERILAFFFCCSNDLGRMGMTPEFKTLFAFADTRPAAAVWNCTQLTKRHKTHKFIFELAPQGFSP